MNIETMKNNSEKVATILKVLSHPQRLCLLCYLSQERKTVSDLQGLCDISQSHVSQFLSKMKLHGLVDSEKEGNFVYYSIADQKVLELMKSLESIYCE